jgi:hypothetical protein
MKTCYKALVGLSISLAMTTAHAWGDREQGILQGLAGAWILGRMLQNNEPQQQPPVVVQPPPPVYVYPAPPPPQVYYYRPTCYQTPYYDQWGRIAYYRQVCR